MLQVEWGALGWLPRALAVLALAYAAYSDVRSREVDDVVWVALLSASAPFAILEVAALRELSLRLYLTSVYLAFSLGLALTALGLWGDADFLALTSVSLLTPPGRGLIAALPSLSVLVNALLAALAYPLLLLARNLRLMHKTNLFEGVEAGRLERLAALFLLTRVPREEYLRRRAVYTPAEEVVGGRRRLVFGLRIRREGAEPQGEYVWVSPYVPFVAAIAVGYALHLIVGCLLDLLLPAPP